jgi:hypothetical protein
LNMLERMKVRASRIIWGHDLTINDRIDWEGAECFRETPLRSFVRGGTRLRSLTLTGNWLSRAQSKA